MKPMEIEKQSFAIIEKELTTQIPPQYKPVVKRVIHTTADFSYETNMVFSEGVDRQGAGSHSKRNGHCDGYQYGRRGYQP